MAKSSKAVSKPVKKTTKKVSAKKATPKKAISKKVAVKKKVVAKKATAAKKVASKIAMKKIATKKVAAKKTSAKKAAATKQTKKKIVTKKVATKKSSVKKSSAKKIAKKNDVLNSSSPYRVGTDVLDAAHPEDHIQNPLVNIDTHTDLIPDKYKERPHDPYHDNLPAGKTKGGQKPSGKKPLWSTNKKHN